MAVQQHIIDDIGTLTKVPNRILTDLVDLTNLCISSAISDAKIKNEDSISLNIGIGVLGIDLINMDCKFVPSKDLKAYIKQAITEGIDPLEAKLDQASIDKLINLCEEVI